MKNLNANKKNDRKNGLNGKKYIANDSENRRTKLFPIAEDSGSPYNSFWSSLQTDFWIKEKLEENDKKPIKMKRKQYNIFLSISKIFILLFKEKFS